MFIILKNMLEKIQRKNSFLFYLIYDILFITGLFLYLPVYFWRKKINFSALKQKFGSTLSFNVNESIWIQVVSVGEVNLIEGFLKRLKEVFDCPVVISTTTLTGNSLARKKYSHLAMIIYCPFDISTIVKKVIAKIRPKIFIAVETEIWPNLYRHLSKNNIPIVIINARVSDKAFKRYESVKELLKPVLNNCFAIGAQNKEYRDKFIYLGADESITKVTGNMKFEGVDVKEKKLSNIKVNYLPILKPENKLLLIAASTHDPEEEIIINIYKELREKGRNLNLLIAPRHPQRTSGIERSILASGFIPVRISQVNDAECSDKTIFILDTIGELLYFYALSDICFVGGSLSDSGGHNILEPVYFLKPTVFGPNMNNFLDIEKSVLLNNAGIKIKNPQELKEVIEKLIDSKQTRQTYRSNCLKVFEREKKALDSNLQLILKALKDQLRTGVCSPSKKTCRLFGSGLSLGLQKWYLGFIEKDNRSFFIVPVYWFFCILAFIYGLAISLRNWFYEKGIFKSSSCKSKVISIGNLSWSGSGKTPISIWLYNKLSKDRKVAILRCGYGDDENELLKDHVDNVFTHSDRLVLAKEKESLFDLFILDDGFQHRRLHRDVDLVVMGAREFRKKQRLIPAYIFREPMSSLKRADIVIVNHVDEISDIESLKKTIYKNSPDVKIFSCKYTIKKIVDLEDKNYDLSYFCKKSIGAFAAIGYPQGFFNKLKAAGFNIKEEVAYPDHYELSLDEYRALEEKLINKGIGELIITHKDKYHLPKADYLLKIFIMEIDLDIGNEALLLDIIKKKINVL